MMAILRGLAAGRIGLLSRSVAVVALTVMLSLPRDALRADSGTPAQQQLQQILAQRHWWRMKLEAEHRHATWVQGKLSTTERALVRQRARLLLEQQRDAAHRANLLSAVEADQLQITRVGSEIVSARLQYSRVHQKALGLLLKLRQLKAEIKREQGNVSASAVQLYEMSQVNPLESVLEAKSLTDLLKVQGYVGQIGSRDYAILQQAAHEHAAVYRVAKVYIDEMAALRRLQRRERADLATIRVATRHEDRLLAAAGKLAARRQKRLQAQEARVQAQADREQALLTGTSSSSRYAAQAIAADQKAAEQVAVEVERETGTVPPGVWPGTTPLAAQAALTAQAYLGQVKSPITPTGYWSGFCEGFAQFVYGEAFQAVSAIAEYHAMLAGGYVRPGIPLRGALVFYGGGEGFGHVAISMGGGKVISTMGYAGDRLPIEENPYLLFPDYLGWAMPF
jgi:cell wall-associated NlpC family hydrolase